MKHTIILIAILVVMIGCAGRTGITQHFPHPINDSIDYHVSCWAIGQYRKPFSDYGVKESGIIIWDKNCNKHLIETQFVIEAGSIMWKCLNMTNEKFVIEIYDCKAYGATEGAKLCMVMSYRKLKNGWIKE